jgi:hypothetical protein
MIMNKRIKEGAMTIKIRTKKPIIKNEPDCRLHLGRNHYYCPDCQVINTRTGKKSRIELMAMIGTLEVTADNVSLECPYCDYHTAVSYKDYHRQSKPKPKPSDRHYKAV